MKSEDGSPKSEVGSKTLFTVFAFDFSFLPFYLTCGSSSVGRASASQAEGREFEPLLPL